MKGRCSLEKRAAADLWPASHCQFRALRRCAPPTGCASSLATQRHLQCQGTEHAMHACLRFAHGCWQRRFASCDTTPIDAFSDITHSNEGYDWLLYGRTLLAGATTPGRSASTSCCRLRVCVCRAYTRRADRVSCCADRCARRRVTSASVRSCSPGNRRAAPSSPAAGRDVLKLTANPIRQIKPISSHTWCRWGANPLKICLNFCQCGKEQDDRHLRRAASWRRT